MAKTKLPAVGKDSEEPGCRRLTPEEIEDLRRWGKEALEKAKAYFRDYDR